ncbi:Predicted dehydrogenase [Paenibacillus sp. UNCCL117]|uniref:Gfo/Idh/MocA family protein n=1 Tax=unclassified Paenibacillus TaxID=185978 RepID=UPI0008907942|nr:MULTISPECIES: Gfo/Idh/MocA family oxidoreductase [unclassified Paenibacillus]SDC66277.1 Predicted dehydrogenase [Paenibacillus sp. cl123]SFW22995.1 Predicted dehydrogenase [Paenibacillus sp. UNCCL117]
MNRLKVGLISFAHGHAFSYLKALAALPEVELTGIAHDAPSSRVEEAARQHGIPFFSDHKKLLAADVDAVVICSENVHHARLTLDAARAGKHVLCEKPLGISVSEMEEMIAVCRDNGVQLMTAFPCRYITAVVRAKEAVDRGDIGEIVAIKGTNRGSMPGGWFVDPALSGGGALLDHTVHVMDLMNWFTGARVTEVYAYAATRFHEHLEVDDTGMIHVKYDNGVFGVLDTSWSRPKAFPTWGDVTMEIIGTQGAISVDSFAQMNELYTNESGKGVWSTWGDSMDEYLVRDFVKAVLAGKSVPITGEDGLRSAEVAIAGYESVKRGQPIALAGR